MKNDPIMSQSSYPKLISTQFIYEKLFNRILSQDEGLDAEKLSQITLHSLGILAIYKGWPGISTILNQIKSELYYRDQRLEQQLFGCHFSHPIGLAAGFDKNGVAASIWDCFGFSFAEIGTVTLHGQNGNPKPRLFRLAAEKAALNRMGFNNDGAKSMRRTLIRQNLINPNQRPLILGINLGKSKTTTLEDAPKDYATSLEILSSFADYAVINVSSPNTPGLRQLQSSKQLRRLIQTLQIMPFCPPLLIKIAPDLKNSEIDEIGRLSKEEEIAGIIATNTSIDRLGLERRVISQTGLSLKEEAGGLSGEPLRRRATEVIRRLYKTARDVPLIGVGGISTPESAWERITAGASLLEVYTGWIFEGPNLVPNILKGLSAQLNNHGFRNIYEAIGSEAPWT
tara:strand:- start:177 stop:1370 length:1194 start_codon:yes stop_codon:yes gene_type:complete